MFRPRINEFPACRAVASGWKGNFGEIFGFMNAWIPGDTVGSPFTSPDFLCFNEPFSFLWLKLLQDDKVDTKGFEMIDFSGGLYVSAIAINNDFDDLAKTIDYLKNWVNEQANFELDFRSGRYRMTRRFTSDESVGTWEKSLGYGQIEVFIPIKVLG